jgi:coenzyme F420-reducing hydrogenase gamma subunit
MAPAVALAALLVATMIFENAAPPATVSSLPDYGQDCYCHKGLAMPVYVNGTEVSSFITRVGAGKSFVLRVEVAFPSQSPTAAPIVVAWLPNMGDNSKFTFNSTQVTDNSRQDQSPARGDIIASFMITAPNESGSYSIAVSYQGSFSEVFVTVGESALASYAAIGQVSGKLAAKPGDLVTTNITLRNNGTEASTFYVYGTNSSTKKVIFDKVYSQAPIAANATTTLTAAFTMPEGNVTLVIHGGHVEDAGDVDDSRKTIYIFQAVPLPPMQRVPYTVLAMEWAPWLAITAASLGVVPVIGMYARKGKPLFSKAERLKMAIVDCAICGGCEVAMADLGEYLIQLLSQKIDLVHAPILMSAREYGPVDVAFVVGAIRNTEDLRIAKQAREKAKILVAFGTCPAFGGLNNLSNLSSRRELLETAFVNAPSMEQDGKIIPNQRVPALMSEVKSLSEYVKVDVAVPGCPPPADAIREAIGLLLNGVSNGDGKK